MKKLMDLRESMDDSRRRKVEEVFPDLKIQTEQQVH